LINKNTAVRIILVYYKLEGFISVLHLFLTKRHLNALNKLFIPDYCQICLKQKSNDILTLALDVSCLIYMSYANAATEKYKLIIKYYIQINVRLFMIS